MNLLDVFKDIAAGQAQHYRVLLFVVALANDILEPYIKDVLAHLQPDELLALVPELLHIFHDDYFLSFPKSSIPLSVGCCTTGSGSTDSVL